MAKKTEKVESSNIAEHQNAGYDRTLSLKYDDDSKCWKIGNFVAEIVLTPALSVKNNHNINSISINAVNKGYDTSYNNFAMGFDSVGVDGSGAPILHTKFNDAYDQLEKNKRNIEHYLNSNIDISVLKDLRPMILEFERRADGRTSGHDELRFD